MEQEKPKKYEEDIGIADKFPMEKESSPEAEKDQAELNFIGYQKKLEKRKRMIKIGAIIFVLGLTIAAILFLVLDKKENFEEPSEKKEVAISISEDKDYVFVNDSGVSNADAESSATKESNEDMRGFEGSSENYRIKDIAIGGGSIVLAATTENLLLKVTDVHSEVLMSKDGKKTQLLLSWKTNKIARSEVKYSKGAKGSEKNAKEGGYGFSHALVLSNLEQSTRYLFTVNAVDRGGNRAVSDTLAVFTGSKPVSIFDLISTQMSDIFGWALGE